METCAVCADVRAAGILLAGGVSVVLVGPPGEGLGDAVAELRGAVGRPGSPRLAAFVGDLDNEDFRAAAVAMAVEQFSANAVVVRSAPEAKTLVGALREVNRRKP